MIDGGVVVVGIPIPSSSPLFLAIVAVHIAAGCVCVIAGAIAMLAPKGSGWHPRAGSVYYWSLVVVFVSMTALTALKWPEDTQLFALGLASLMAASVGRSARRSQQPGKLRKHVTGMSVSYIVLLTAFYVDNGLHLPVWRALPTWAFWILPGAVGTPVLLHVLSHHPLLAGAHKK